MDVYNEKLEYTQYAAKQRPWGWSVGVCFKYVADGRLIDYSIDFNQEDKPEEKEITLRIADLAEKTVTSFEEIKETKSEDEIMLDNLWSSKTALEKAEIFAAYDATADTEVG